MLVAAPNMPVVPVEGTVGWVLDPNIPVEAAGVPNKLPPEVPPPNPF